MTAERIESRDASARQPKSGRRLALGGGVAAIVVVLMLISSPLAVASPREPMFGIHVGKNIDIMGEGAPDWPVRESAMAVDPRNTQIVVAAAIDTSLAAHGGHTWDRYYRSTDGGKTWSSDFVPGFPGDNSPAGRSSPLRGYNVSIEPSIAFSDSGIVYFSLAAAQVPAGQQLLNLTSEDIAVAEYSNDGATYLRTAVVEHTKVGTGHPRIAVDTSGGPYEGYVYVSVPPHFLYRSTDGGKTFAHPPVALRGYDARDVAVSPGGVVYVLTLNPCGPAYPYACNGMRVWASTDGGASFGPSVLAARDFVGGQDPNPTFTPNFWEDVWRIAAGPCGAVYVAYPDYFTGHVVMLVRSLDEGKTWSTPVNLSDSPGSQQFSPAISVAGSTVSVAWYDSRNGQLPNGNISRLDLYYSISWDRGASFSPNVRVTDRSFDPTRVFFDDSWAGFGFAPPNSPWIGEYLGIAGTPSHGIHLSWTDNRDACEVTNATYGCVDQDVLTATITFGDD